MSSLPACVKHHLPDNNLSVLTFLAYDLPLLDHVTGTQFMRLEKYLCQSLPNSENMEEIFCLPSLPIDTIKALAQQIRNNPDITSIQCPHSPSSGGKRFPLWVIPYWIHLHDIYETKATWKLAVSRLRNRIETEDHTSDLLHQAFNALSYTPWAGRIEGGERYIDSPLLSMLFTDAWLTDEHVAVMLDLLKEDLCKEGVIRQMLVEEPTFFQCLIAAYDDRACYTTDRSYAWLRKKGEDLAAGRTGPLVSIPNKGGVHWIALVIDFEDRIIHYGDALDNPFTGELKDVIEWWT